jgi:hypothetical protein
VIDVAIRKKVSNDKGAMLTANCLHTKNKFNKFHGSNCR